MATTSDFTALDSNVLLVEYAHTYLEGELPMSSFSIKIAIVFPLISRLYYIHVLIIVNYSDDYAILSNTGSELLRIGFHKLFSLLHLLLRYLIGIVSD